MAKIVENSIKDKLSSIEGRSAVADVISANGWMQLYGIISNIDDITQDMTTEIFENQNSVIAQSTASLTGTYYLVQCFVQFVYHYYDKFVTLLGQDSTLTKRELVFQHQQVINRLGSFWQTISGPILATQGIYASYKDINHRSQAWRRARLLDILVSAAQPGQFLMQEMTRQTREKQTRAQNSVSPDRPWLGITMPQFGSTFQLIGVAYAPFVYLTSLPLYDLDAPWVWSVVWHEMGGRIASIFRRSSPSEIDSILERVRALPGNLWEDSCKKHYLALGKTAHVNGSDNVLNVDPDHPFPSDEGWISELTEDAYATISLGPSMLPTIASVLRQNNSDDDQITDAVHPTPRLRMHMVIAQLLNMGFDTDTLTSLEASATDGIKAAKKLQPLAQILKDVLVVENSCCPTPFTADSPLAAETQTLKEKLKKGQPLDSQSSIKALVAASRLAFLESPESAAKISQAVSNRILELDQNVGQAPSSFLYEALPETFFTELVSKDVNTWQDLLGKPFQDIDFFNFDHDHPHLDGVLDFWSRGVHHRVSHFQTDHR